MNKHNVGRFVDLYADYAAVASVAVVATLESVERVAAVDLAPAVVEAVAPPVLVTVLVAVAVCHGLGVIFLPVYHHRRYCHSVGKNKRSWQEGPVARPFHLHPYCRRRCFGIVVET